MSKTSDVEDGKEKEMVVDHDSGKNLVDDGKPDDDKHQIYGEEVKDSQEDDKSSMPSAQQEEDAIKKKYGGLLPRKPPLISKDHERAFFDSADWALGKQGAQKPKGPLEALRPKLQPTPHQQIRSRRSAYAPADDTEGDNDGNFASSSEDQSCTLDKDNNSNIADEDQIQGLQDKDKSLSG